MDDEIVVAYFYPKNLHNIYSTCRDGLVCRYISECRCMVLPLSANPTAAAQGALGIEVSTAPEKEHVRKVLPLASLCYDVIGRL